MISWRVCVAIALGVLFGAAEAVPALAQAATTERAKPAEAEDESKEKKKPSKSKSLLEKDPKALEETKVERRRNRVGGLREDPGRYGVRRLDRRGTGIRRYEGTDPYRPYFGKRTYYETRKGALSNARPPGYYRYPRSLGYPAYRKYPRAYYYPPRFNRKPFGGWPRDRRRGRRFW